jgi:hypothetical protein
MVVFPLTRAQPAWGQGTTDPVSPLDTLFAAADTTQWFSLAPTFTGTSKANVTSVSLGGRYQQTIEMATGLRLSTMLNARKQDFRLQARSNENKLFQNTLSQDIGLGWWMELNHMDSRLFNRVIAADGGFQDVVLNTLTLSAGVRHVTIGERDLRWDGRAMVVLGDAEKTFKTDKSSGAEVGGGFAYNLLSDMVVVRGRRYHQSIRADSKSSLEAFHNLEVYQDSMSADVSVHFTDKQYVNYKYEEYEANEEFTDQERTSTGTQKLGPENLYREHRTVKARVTNVGFRSTMMGGLSLNVDAKRNDHYTHYMRTPTRFSHNITNTLQSEIKYRLFTGTLVTANLKVENAERDLGPQSASSNERNERMLRMNVRHGFDADTFVDMFGSVSLLQTFYDPNKNIRDNDQLEHRLNVRLNSKPFSKLRATVNGTYIRTEFVNMNATLSSGNRVKSNFDFGPSITYTMNPRIEITQNYGLSIEFTDHTFEQDADTDNFLDRNVTFSNEVVALLTPKLRTTFRYGFHFHDRGSYLRTDEDGDGEPDEEGTRYMNREREDRRDEIRIRLRYQINGHLALIGDQRYSRRENRTIGSDIVSVTEDGSIELGVQGSYNWSKDRKLTMKIQKAKRFSPFVTEAQKDFWIVDAELLYGF